MNFSSSGLRLQSGGNYNSQQPRRERNRSTSRLPFPVGHQLQLPAPLPKAAGGCGGQPRSESQGGWPQSHAPRTVLGEAAGSGAGVAERRSDVTSGGRPAGRPAQIERSVLSSALSSAAPAPRCGRSEPGALETGFGAPTRPPFPKSERSGLREDRVSPCRPRRSVCASPGSGRGTPGLSGRDGEGLTWSSTPCSRAPRSAAGAPPEWSP